MLLNQSQQEKEAAQTSLDLQEHCSFTSFPDQMPQVISPVRVVSIGFWCLEMFWVVFGWCYQPQLPSFLVLLNFSTDFDRSKCPLPASEGDAAEPRFPEPRVQSGRRDARFWPFPRN